jgi:hypothetical protein
LIGSSIYTYESYCLETKTKLDQIDPELWPRFTWINPVRFYRIKENKNAICNSLNKQIIGTANEEVMKKARTILEKGLKIIEMLEIKTI